MVGTVLRGRYELTALISDGPVFTHYSARDQIGGNDISVRVVKQPYSIEEGFLQGLANSIRKYQSIQSHGVESLYALEEDGQTRLVVGEMTRGAPLSERIKKLAPFSVPVSVSTGISICHALEALHRANLAHGDLCSQNIVIASEGEAKLQMAGVWEAYSGSPTAGAAVLPGMAKYLAPEVSSGEMPSPRSDVYSVGILLYELLTGRPPYVADAPLALAMKHATVPTPSVRSANPSVPMVLDEIVKKAMAKDPDQRYRTAGEMLSDLRMLQDALRFGRTLTWPIRATSTPSGTAPAPRPQPVAPRMSAIRDDGDEVRQPKQERDVPVWMMVTLAFLGAVVLSLVGVWLIFNLNKPRLVTVPDVKGQNAAEARRMLEDLKLDMRIAARRPDERVDAENILEVHPPPGDKVREGGTVAVVLSSGSRFVQVPDVKNLTLDKAKSILDSLNLDLDTNVDKVSSGDVPEGQIISQRPPPRQRVERLTKVKVVVSSGSSGVRSIDDGDAESYVYDVRIRLVDMEETSDVKIEISDDRGTREAYSRTHDPYDVIELPIIGYGNTAILRIYYNGELRKTETVYASRREE